MKNFFTQLIISSFLIGNSLAEFETWTNQEGNAAKMKLIEVIKNGDEVSGKFEMVDGRFVTLRADVLSEESATRLRAWEPKPELKSAFDEMLAGNLVALDGREFAAFELAQKPEKFYVFYYTASWCPPCRTYTPELVKFYNRAKKDGSNFELFLVTADRDEAAMLKYARDNKMPWPHVTFDKAREVSGKLGHEARTIPSVIVCDFEGNVVSRDRSIDNLETILTK